MQIPDLHILTRMMCTHQDDVLFKKKKIKEFRLIQGMRFLSILFNLVNIRGVVQHK